MAGPGYSPFIKIAGSDVVYNAPIVATGDGPFDVTHHTNTADRALAIHIAGPSAPGQFAESWVDMLFVKGFDAGQPIVYLSTDAGQPLTAVLERSVYVPALNDASFNGGDDFLGSARERLFGFINGQTGVNNPQAQGFQHLAKDGMVGQDASLANTAFINALRYGGDLLNVFGDFPTLTDPRHADAYSPLWDAQLGLWTPKAVAAGLNKRQIDEIQVFNLAATQPDLLTGVNPATGQPEPYGSVGSTSTARSSATPPGPHRQPRAPGAQLPVPAQVTGQPPQARVPPMWRGRRYGTLTWSWSCGNGRIGKPGRHLRSIADQGNQVMSLARLGRPMGDREGVARIAIRPAAGWLWEARHDRYGNRVLLVVAGQPGRRRHPGGRGEPTRVVVTVARNAAGQAQHLAVLHRPRSSVLLFSHFTDERFAGTPVAEHFVASEC